jgi:fructose-specific phosphotransferase system IIC component
MKALFVVLVLSTVTVLVAAIAMWWRLRQHLSKSDEALKNALQEIEPEQEAVER